MQPLTAIATTIINIINGALVPLVFAVAFIFFLFGVFRYFIAGGANEEKRREGRQMIIYSVIGFAIMISIWGIVNLVIATFGKGNTAMPALPTFGGASSNTSNTTNTSGTNPPTSVTPTTYTPAPTTVSPGNNLQNDPAQIDSQYDPPPFNS